MGRTEWTVVKYSGGVCCGDGIFETLDQCFAFANDGFCDYCRITGENGDVLKLHFKTANQGTLEPVAEEY